MSGFRGHPRFVNEASVYLQAAGFGFGPEGPVVTAVYSIGASGRLMRDDVLSLVRTSFLRQGTEEQLPIGGEVGKWRSHL